MDRTAKITYNVRCILPVKYFDCAWQDIPKETRDIIVSESGLPCDAGGVMGEWCDRCAFGTVEREDD